MNTLKISSALIEFKQSVLSSTALDALVSNIVASLNPVDDKAIIEVWQDWGKLPFNKKEYKEGWTTRHNRGKLPPQMVAKNARGQTSDAIIAEVERVAGNQSALWGRQDNASTFLKQETRRKSAPELNAARELNNQRAVARLALREIPDLKDDIKEIGFE